MGNVVMFKALVEEAQGMDTGAELYKADNWEFYEEVFMQTVYETVEENTGLFLEPSVKPEYGTGIVVAWTNGGNEDCEEAGSFKFEDELTAMLGVLQDITGEITEDTFNEAVDKAVEIITGWLGSTGEVTGDVTEDTFVEIVDKVMRIINGC